MANLLFLLLAFVHPNQHSVTENQIQKGRHEFVRKGSHANELALGTYVVFKSFKDKIQAEASAADYTKSGLSDVKFGFVTVKNFWYVVSGPYTDTEKAFKDVESLGAKEATKDCWLLTVHEGAK